MLRTLTRLTTAVALLAGLSACADDAATNPDLANDGKAGFTLLLTDAPGDFHSAVVTISEINLHGVGGSEPLLDAPLTVDLIDLRNEVAYIVRDLELPPGDYEELRLVITGGYIEVEGDDGSTRIFASSPDYAGLPVGASVDGQLHMPSMGQSGLKVKLPGTVDIGEDDTIVMIDFDVEESFGHEAGKSGRWIMHPVIRATDVTYGGHVLAQLQLGDGVVLPELAGALLTLADFPVQLVPVGGGDARVGTLSDDNADGIYEFMFKGLVPGDYALGFVVPDGLLATFSPVLPITVTVHERETTTQLVTLASAELAGEVTATLVLADTVTLPIVNETQLTVGHYDAELTPDGGTAITVDFTDADEDGVYEAVFSDLPAGNYTLAIVAPDGVTTTYSVTLPIAVELLEGEAETHAIVITEAAASSP